MRLIFFAALITIVAFSACKRADNASQPQSGASAPPSAQSNAASSASTPATPTHAAQTKAKIDACGLLTSAEIESIQNEGVKETRHSGSSQGGFTVSQCFFTLPTFTKSVSLQLTQRADGSGGRDPQEFWRETFHRESESEKEREKKKEARQEEEEGESARPLKVTGIGDDAFWVASRVGGALYVLKGARYIRVAIGGGGSREDQIRKSKNLAQKVVDRL